MILSRSVITVEARDYEPRYVDAEEDDEGEEVSLMRGKGCDCYMIQSSPSRMDYLGDSRPVLPGCEIEIETIGSMTSTASAPHAAQPVASSAIRQCVDTRAPGQSSSTIWTMIMGFWYRGTTRRGAREGHPVVHGTNRQSGNSPESAPPSRP